MTSIIEAKEEDYKLLTEIGQLSFRESHGHSAKPEDINNFLTQYYSENAFREELSDEKNVYHIIYHNNRASGYSKIIFDYPYEDSQIENITKLERIYLLKEFYNLKLGLELFQFIIDLSKENNQLGIWLFVWQENQRAINFYKKNGFVITGSYQYKISETHSNPNYQMFLKY